jgi:hypothetical protein
MLPETNHDTRPGLPPVEPPTGRLLAQLFLVPGLIVAGVVVLLLFFNWLVSGPRSPESYLKRLDDPNTEVRWRAAADLSQVLLRDDHLAGDPDLALALAVRLDEARTGSARAEAEFAERVGKLSPEDATRQRQRLEPERNYIQYLAACLGNFMMPTGAVLLQEMARTDHGLEPRLLAENRRRAVWALANLGQNLERFDRLPSVEQETLRARLAAAGLPSNQAKWVHAAHAALAGRAEGRQEAMGVDRTLEECAAADDPFLRELTALALNFWHGGADAEARMEKTLLRLSNDEGRGQELLDQWAEDDPAETRPVTKIPGLNVRMNAMATLARRGSVKVRLGVLEEMLDEEALRGALVLRSKNGSETPDEATILNTMLTALKAVGELHQRQPDLAMPRVRAAVDRLAAHPNVAIQAAAKQTQLVLGGSSR